MTITTTIQQRKSIDIAVPCFYEDSTIAGITKAIGILGENDVISIFHSDTRTSVSSDLPESQTSAISEAMGEWKSITEERFFEIHTEAMRRLSLSPVLINKQTAL